MNKRKKDYHLKVDLRAFFAPLEKPVMLGETPSIDTTVLASDFVLCPLPPKNFFSMAAVHADIFKRGIYVSLPQTKDEVKRDLDSILSQQPLIPSLSDAKKLAGSLLPNHLNAKTK